jgi:hypothetical protein
MIELTYEQLETIGAMADKADNLVSASMLDLPVGIHIQCLTAGLREIRETLREVHDAINRVDTSVCMWCQWPVRSESEPNADCTRDRCARLLL